MLEKDHNCHRVTTDLHAKTNTASVKVGNFAATGWVATSDTKKWPFFVRQS